MPHSRNAVVAAVKVAVAGAEAVVALPLRAAATLRGARRSSGMQYHAAPRLGIPSLADPAAATTAVTTVPGTRIRPIGAWAGVGEAIGAAITVGATGDLAGGAPDMPAACGGQVMAGGADRRCTRPPYWGITSNARFLVTPRNAEVYVDGALAGIVDQYDGTFQSLTLAPGTHQISLFLDGYHRQDSNVYVAPGSTLKLRHTMEALPEGATPDERPVLAPRPQQAAVVADPDGSPTTAPAPGAPRSPRPIVGEAGVLVIRVQPADAEIVIDGQRWQTPDAKNHPLEVRVPPGRVRVEVRKPGFAPFSTEVTVEPGEITPLNVSLPPQGEKL